MTKSELEPHLRRVYPSGDLYEARVGELDVRFRSRFQSDLAGDLRAIPGIAAEVMPLDLPWSRSCTVNVGLDRSASWVRFNRARNEGEREGTLERAGGSVAFWTVQMSRVGPVWTGVWNEFPRRNKAVVPVIVPEPPGWRGAATAVTTVLSRHRVTEMPSELLNQPVSWMIGSTTPSVTSDERPPSIY